MPFFKIVYWTAMLVQIVVRVPYSRMWKAGKMTERRVSRTENLALGLLFSGSLLLPLLYSFGLLDFANYSLPLWLGGLGVLLIIASLFVFARSHIDLKANWSPSLEIRSDHTLITDGIYRYVRHPMYASQLLWSLAQMLLIQNWLAGPLGLLTFLPFYLLRVRAEEKLMLDTFGAQYADYMKKVGGVIPKLNRP